MSLKYWQGPEWSAHILEQAAEDTLAKVRMYNADADIWRLLRPEDFGANVQTPVGVATVPFPINQIAEKQYTYNVILAAGVSNIIIQFVVPAGLGITFMGFWITTHLGQGCVYEIDVNRVKRQEAPIRGMKGKNYAFDDSGVIRWNNRILPCQRYPPRTIRLRKTERPSADPTLCETRFHRTNRVLPNSRYCRQPQTIARCRVIFLSSFLPFFF